MLSLQFSREFLDKMARTHRLSFEQKEVFLLHFADELDYDKIAEILNTSKGACLKRMGEVYRKFDLIGKTRGKENLLRNFLEEEYQQWRGESSQTSLKSMTLRSDKQRHIESPDSPVDSDSRFYIKRPPIETLCEQEILERGALIEIKAPQKMGKTSLMLSILKYAEKQGYQTVNLNLDLADKIVLSNSKEFLKNWFCDIIDTMLELDSKDYWNEERIPRSNVFFYFEKYLLKKIETPLVLALDDVDLLFSYPNIAEEFFSLLRVFHERSKGNPIWAKLKLILVYSTDKYISMDVNQSPFNVGLPIELAEFTPAQVQDLAKKHELLWNEENNHKLMNMVGGHPYLVRLAFYSLATRLNFTLDELLELAPTDAGIYKDHLRQLLNILENKEYYKLKNAMEEVISSQGAVSLESPELEFKLYSLGLVTFGGNNIKVSYPLYRDYFRQKWGI